jgi:hypothetical protein
MLTVNNYLGEKMIGLVLWVVTFLMLGLAAQSFQDGLFMTFVPKSNPKKVINNS